MARPITDLGPEIPDCPGRAHGTYHAVHKAGCVCPSAIEVYRECKRRWERGRRRRYRHVDQLAVEQAAAGLIAARKLTTDERRQVVSRLVTQGRTHQQIADLLRWSGGGTTGRRAVAQFCSRWGIRARGAVAA